MPDLVIRGGTVVAGDGSGAREADVVIQNGRIAAVGVGVAPSSGPSIDARGKVVAPGFIDLHTHSDFTPPLRPSAEAKLLQGVTTDVTGNCGFSPFPLTDDAVSVKYGAFFEPELDRRWNSLDAFAHDMEQLEPAINVATLVGLGAVRLAVLGEDDRPATDGEIVAMQDLVAAALDDGAFGASSGLVYAPGATPPGQS